MGVKGDLLGTASQQLLPGKARDGRKIPAIRTVQVCDQFPQKHLPVRAPSGVPVAGIYRVRSCHASAVGADGCPHQSQNRR